MGAEMKEKHRKRRAMLERRAERAKLWLYTDDKPKPGLHPVIVDDIKRKFLSRRLVVL
jgi:hypothetical protein